MDLEVDIESSVDISLRPNLRVFDSPNMEVEHLYCTVPEAELMNFIV